MYAWGNNAMGQCGQGHTSTPVNKPKKVIGLEGVSIQQITAGTSHSLAWTAVPTDRYVCCLVLTQYMQAENNIAFFMPVFSATPYGQKCVEFV